MPSIELGIMYKAVNQRKNSLCSHKAYIIVRRKKMKNKTITINDQLPIGINVMNTKPKTLKDWID